MIEDEEIVVVRRFAIREGVVARYRFTVAQALLTAQ
jgi:hypothetical protein